jgi:hypothetical protein
MFFAGIAVIIRKQNIDRRKHMMDHFDSYAGILNYHMEKAFDIIHKDQILIYSLEATGISDEHFDAASKSFGKLVIKMIGPMLYKEFVYMYGDENTFIYNVIEYFNTRYETDEIRQQALENLSEEE